MLKHRCTPPARLYTGAFDTRAPTTLNKNLMAGSTGRGVIFIFASFPENVGERCGETPIAAGETVEITKPGTLHCGHVGKWGGLWNLFF